MPFRRWGLLACALLLASPCLALGAQQVALGFVNTSTGVKPTSTKNKDALITDPSLSFVEGSTPMDFFPAEGLLNTHFDPTQYQLYVDPNVGTFSLGTTVQGAFPYQVLGFEVQTSDGGLIDVQDNGNNGDTYSQITSGPLDPTDGAVGGTETGNVYDIHFKIINDEQSSALSSDQDQNFYQLFLTRIGANPPGDDSTFPTTFANDPADTSFVTFDPEEGTTGLSDFTVINGVDGGVINGSVVPEVSSAGFLAIGGLTLFLRRRKAKKQGEAAVSLISPTPPDPA